MNVIARLEIKLASYDSAVHRFNHYATRTTLINAEIMKRITSKKKTTLLSLRNHDWRTIMSETKKLNDLWINIQTKIRKLNDIIYAGGKLVCEIIWVLLKTTNRKSKPWWEIRLESLIRKLRQFAKMQGENMKIYSDEAEKTRQLQRKIQLEKTNQKVLAKEGRLKKYQDRTEQYRLNSTFQNYERKFYQ